MRIIAGILIFMLLIGNAILPVSGRFQLFEENSQYEQSIPFQSGTTEFKWMFGGDAIRSFRSYWLHVPPDYDGTESTPLVLALHGSMGLSLRYPFFSFRSCWMEDYTEMSDKADEEGFIVVYPKSELIFDPDFKQFYFAFFVPTYPVLDVTHLLIDDVGFIRDLITKIREDYNIDSDRIYITGLSNGGDFTYYLGAELSDIIAGIAPVAGYAAYKDQEETEYNYIPTPDNPVSVIVFHGMNDSLMPYEGNEWGIGVDESVEYWVNHNGCNPESLIEISDSGNIIKETYTNGLNNTEVVLYKTVRGDHWWPGNSWDEAPGAPWLVDTVKEISANDLIWEFFESHPKQ